LYYGSIEFVSESQKAFVNKGFNHHKIEMKVFGMDQFLDVIFLQYVVTQ
jgi:hypothetical protein